MANLTPYVDGHLDLAFNALAAGRDLTLPLAALRRDHPNALVTLPELQQAGIKLVFGTIFVRPQTSLTVTAKGASLPGDTYSTPDEARAQGLQQLALYERWEDEGRVRIIRTRDDLAPYLALQDDVPLGLVVLMEGADPLRTPDELSEWVRRGLRMIGPAWQQTRYSAGTKTPGPLTDLGKELLIAMREQNVTLDASHLAEEAFWQALELKPNSVIASHSNARALVPTDRQLSDAMISAIGDHGGVVGLVIANVFLQRFPEGQMHKADVTLDHVARHAAHVAGLIGWDKVAIGSDFDGGFGVDDVPAELGRALDFAKLAAAVPPAAQEDFLGGTWLRFLTRVLPAS